MDAFTNAINTVLQLLVQIGNLIVAGLVAVELWVRGQLAAAGMAPSLQTVVMVSLAALLILAALRLFGGLIRAIVILVLILIAIHIVLPVLPH
nr:hypothetical protein [uncultured Rhodopila sp.]